MSPAQFTLLISLLCLIGCASTSEPAQAPVAATTQASQEAKLVTQSTSTSAPELSEQTIMGIVKSHFEELQTCYETTLASDNTLAGIVELELTISGDGTIEEGRLLKDGLGSAELNLCLVKKMVDWKFPAHKDEAVTIQFPFSFSPKSPGR